MKKALRLLKVIRSYLPTKLPAGMAEFMTWSDNIIELVGPIADTDSMRYAIASQLIHLPAIRASVPNQYFIRSLRKAAANQVASQVFQDIKIRQEKRMKEEQEKLQLEQAAKESENKENVNIKEG